MLKLIIIPFLTVLFFVTEVSAETVKQFDYPELVVTPLASKRIWMEAAKENRTAWPNMYAIQGSAGLTALAGLMVLNESNDSINREEQNRMAGLTGIAAGITWGGLTSWLAISHRPYRRAKKVITKLGHATRKERLSRERIAEEHINQAASFAKKVIWLSVITNAATAGFIAASSEQSHTQAMAGIALVTAFAPLIVNNNYVDVMHHHESYKKRIYGPIASTTILHHAPTSSLQPGLLITWKF